MQHVDFGLATQALKQLKLDGQNQKDNVQMALNAACGPSGSGMRLVSTLSLELAISEFAVKDLDHIVHHCPAWHTERREAMHCVKLYGLLPVPKRQVVVNHEPDLVSRFGVHTVWTDGSGRHSSNLVLVGRVATRTFAGLVPFGA
eukprot:4515711-Amphidinium_carterae.1